MTAEADQEVAERDRKKLAARAASSYRLNINDRLAWSSGLDEDFGGYFFCLHGIDVETKDRLKSASADGSLTRFLKCVRSPVASLLQSTAPNPYSRVVTITRRNGLEQDYTKWFFFDETGDEHGPYNSLRRATRELMKHCYWLEHGPTRWQRIWWPVKKFIKAVAMEYVRIEERRLGR